MFEHIIYKESTLSNGLKVLTAQNNSVPVVDVQVWTRTGYRYENPDEAGYAHLLEHMLFGGTTRRPTIKDLALEVDRRGGYFNAMTNQESVVYEMQMMRQDVDQMGDILSDMLMESILSPERLDNERKVVLQELKQKQENHGEYLFRLAQKRVLPGHPMSNNILDTEQTTNEATSERLRIYLKSHYRPDQSALVLSGDVSHDQAVALAEKYFVRWSNPLQPFDAGLKPMPHAAEHYYFQKRDIKQSFLSLAFYTSPLGDLSESAAWRLLSVHLSGGFTAALVQELREKLGLIYNIRSARTASHDIGLYSVSTSTQKPRETVDAIDRVIARISDELTAEVFERVKGQAIGTFVRYIVKPDNQAEELGGDFITYNRLLLPQEWTGCLQEVTREQVIDLARKYLNPENSVLVLLGPDDIGR